MKFAFGLMTEGFWNCGLAGWAPNCVKPVTLCAFRARTISGSVGMPLVMPFEVSRLVAAQTVGRLAAFVMADAHAEVEQRSRSHDVGHAECDLPVVDVERWSWRCRRPTPPKVGGSKIAVWCWLYTPKTVSFGLKVWSMRASPLSSLIVPRGNAE